MLKFLMKIAKISVLNIAGSFLNIAASFLNIAHMLKIAKRKSHMFRISLNKRKTSVLKIANEFLNIANEYRC